MLKINNFSFKYIQSNKLALKNINLRVDDGEILVICGDSGCGKTTLLKNIKKEIRPVGERTGMIESDFSEIGIVFQNPETQLVTSSVIHDLTFHMENSGVNSEIMRKRIAETVSFFGIENLLHRNTDTLSGGQKQITALCSELMMQPGLLLLDEPVSQLDPIASREFLDMLKRVNQESSITIILTEHRLDDVISIADKVAMFKNGEMKYYGTPKEVINNIWQNEDNAGSAFIPYIPRCSMSLGNSSDVCLTPKELRTYIKKDNDIMNVYNQNNGKIKDVIKNESLDKDIKKNKNLNKDIAVSIKDVSYRYDGSEDYVLKKLSFEVYKNEFICLLGGNGSGKSTLLKAIVGIIRPYIGKMRVRYKKLGYMPQNLNTYFVTDSVQQELQKSLSSGSDKNFYEYIVDTLSIEHLMKSHPYDLSGGEQQKVVLASILLSKPDLIVLDEPTKGIDPNSKILLLKLLKESGAAIIASTHDLEFAASAADRCAMLFDGDISFAAEPKEFFKGNRYYTTSINKAFTNICDDMITYKDVLKKCGKEKPSFLQDY